jgi:hypothetical protein
MQLRAQRQVGLREAARFAHRVRLSCPVRQTRPRTSHRRLPGVLMLPMPAILEPRAQEDTRVGQKLLPCVLAQRQVEA